MTLLKLLTLSGYFILYSPIIIASFKLRDPFDFGKKNKQKISITATQEPNELLNKWNIEEISNNVFIMKNIDDGTIRTIEISSTGQ